MSTELCFVHSGAIHSAQSAKNDVTNGEQTTQKGAGVRHCLTNQLACQQSQHMSKDVGETYDKLVMHELS